MHPRPAARVRVASAPPAADMSGPELFTFSLSPAELVLRGSATYWFLFAIFRFVLRRAAGSLGMADVLIIVLIADASQNAMAGEYRTLADGAVLISTLAGWALLLDWAGYKSRRLARWIDPPALPLVRRGVVDRRAMRRELMSTDELMSQLRAQGVADLAEVELAFVEPNGDVSVIRRRRAKD